MAKHETSGAKEAREAAASLRDRAAAVLPKLNPLTPGISRCDCPYCEAIGEARQILQEIARG